VPKEGSNIKRTPSGRWSVRFKVKITVQDPSGPKVVWKDRERSFDSRADAEDFRASVRLTAARGEVWQDQRDVAVSTFGRIADDYCAAASTAPLSTRKFRRTMMNGWTQFVGTGEPVTGLSVSLLERYAATLPSEGRKASTRHRKVLEVERMWRWARRRPDLYPGVPEFAQITGTDADAVRMPDPVVRTASPTWADLDRMRAQLAREADQRVALVLRFTGMRVSQARELRWTDVELDDPQAGPFVRLRAARRGAKKGRGRVVPLHPELAAAMRSWRSSEPEEEVVGHTTYGRTWLAFRRAWEAAEVPRERWDVSDAEREAGERQNGSPFHSYRSAVKVGLIRAGVDRDVVDYFIGHSQGPTTRAYVPEDAPETSPYWAMLVEAVAKIPPPPREVVTPDNVRELRR
jgi:integrase